MNFERLALQLVESVVFGFLGVLLCTVLFVILVRVSPFSIRKEIEEDQNIALGVIIGGAFIGIAIIIAAAIHSN